MNIFVANLNPLTKGEDLNNLFSTYGTVNSAKIIYDKETGNSKRFGFVEMPNENEGNQAIQALNDSHLNENVIVVKESVPTSNQNRPQRSRTNFFRK